MSTAFVEYFRCCPELSDRFRCVAFNGGPVQRGFFEFGEEAVCFGTVSGQSSRDANGPLLDASGEIGMDGRTWELPFLPDEVVENLRRERYVVPKKDSVWSQAVRWGYYGIRPALPVGVRRHMQKLWLGRWQERRFPRWPVDRSVDQLLEQLMRMAIVAEEGRRIPFIWFWPEGYSACALMTHDVETWAGLNDCDELMDVDDSWGIKSSFQLVPAGRYVVSEERLRSIRERDFEVNVHDLTHDGRLFDSYEHFHTCAGKINAAGRRYKSKGFRSAVLYRNQDWLPELEFDYDMSVPSVAHLDPQRGGCCTVMPYFVGDLVEIPVTVTQDYTLFHVLQTYSTELWHQQLATIVAQHGVANIIVHPDYLDTDRAMSAYKDLLKHLSDLRAEKGVWIPLPRDAAEWWKKRSKMRLVGRGGEWHIEGDGAERARIAFAVLEGDRLKYELA